MQRYFYAIKNNSGKFVSHVLVIRSSHKISHVLLQSKIIVPTTILTVARLVPPHKV